MEGLFCDRSGGVFVLKLAASPRVLLTCPEKPVRLGYLAVDRRLVRFTSLLLRFCLSFSHPCDGSWCREIHKFGTRTVADAIGCMWLHN
eukprot:s2962_g2.t1